MIFVALLGSSLLGYLTAWFFQSERVRKLYLAGLEHAESMSELKANFEKHSLENEGLRLSLENLQKLLESYENQATALEKELLTTRKICEELYDAHKPSSKVAPEIIKEIEVIREVPVLVFQDNSKKAVTHEEKAAKLIRAFKKGIEIEIKKAV